MKDFILQIHKTGFFHLLSSNFLVGLSGFASQLLVAYWLTPEDLGTIKIFQNFVLIASVLFSLGINSAILKLISENHDDKTLHNIFIVSFVLSITCSLLLILLTYILILIFFSKSSYYNIFINFTIIILFINIYYIQSAYLQARRMVKKLAFMQFFSRIAGIFSIIALTYFYKLNGFFWGFLLSYAINNILFCTALRDIELVLTAIKEQTMLWYKKIWKYAKFGWGSNLCGHIIAYSDILFISIFMPKAQSIGQYAFAATFIMGYQMITSTLQQIIAPKFSFLHSKHLDIYTKYKMYLTKIIIFSFAITVISLFAYKPFTHLIYGNKYSDSFIFFIFFIFSWFIKNIYTYQMSLLFGMGYFNKIFHITLYLTIITIIAMFIIGQTGSIIYMAMLLPCIAIMALLFYTKTLKGIFNENQY